MVSYHQHFHCCFAGTAFSSYGCYCLKIYLKKKKKNWATWLILDSPTGGWIKYFSILFYYTYMCIYVYINTNTHSFVVILLSIFASCFKLWDCWNIAVLIKTINFGIHCCLSHSLCVCMGVGPMDDVLDCICPLYCRGDYHWSNIGMVSYSLILYTHPSKHAQTHAEELIIQ